MPGPRTFVFLARPRPNTPKEHWTSTLEYDFSYLANLTNEAFKEELLNLAYYTRRAYAIQAIGGDSRWDAFLCNQCREEKRLLEESICNLTLQQDMSLQDVQKAYIYFTMIYMLV